MPSIRACSITLFMMGIMIASMVSACTQNIHTKAITCNELDTVARSNMVNIWMTTGDKTKLLTQQPSIPFTSPSIHRQFNSNTIFVNETKTYQIYDGFGYTLTEGSAEVLLSLTPQIQNDLLNELFGKNGIGISALRISLGASDLSGYAYSYHDGDKFSLQGPDLDNLIPMIKKIQKIVPDIKILATPWSAPRWMKDNNSWMTGYLLPEHYENYAIYFVKYLQAMRELGIEIWGITPQNEPENWKNEPSLLMTAEQQLTFINKNLGPRIREAGFLTKIIGFDHNCDNIDYPIKVANGSKYVDGSAFHLYLGDVSAMTKVKEATNKNVYMTEQWTSSEGTFDGDLAWHIENVVIGSSNNWAKTIFEWNLANNSTWGPRTPNGCTSCLGAITVNSPINFQRNVSYYIIGQVSKFVKVNAIRIASNNAGDIKVTAYRNVDKSIVVIATNTGNKETKFTINWENKTFDYSLPPGSVASFIW